MKRELLVPLILIIGVSMLVTPIAAQEGVVIPFDLESHGYGKMKVGEKWGFWPIYCRGCATFNYDSSTWGFWDTNVYLNIDGRRCDAYADWWYIYDVLDTMEACGPIFTFELPAPYEWDTNGFELGGARVVLFVMSGVPDPWGDGGELADPDACGIVVVYGSGYFYIGRIDYIDWYTVYVLAIDG